MKNFEEKFMKRAIELASYSIDNNLGGPFGAVIVRDGEIIGEGFNRVTTINDPTAHAEIVAIRNACKNINSFQLDNCQIYSSCEPCPMCLGAIYWARPSALYFASAKEDASKAGFDDSMIYKEILLSIDKRKIKSVYVPSEQAKNIFEKWITITKKTMY